MEAMAEAVEESDVVLVCLSRKYKESLNCRTGRNNNIHHHFKTSMERRQNVDYDVNMIMVMERLV